MAPAKNPKSFIAWNVNSLKAIWQKNTLQPFLKAEEPDIFCMGETKLNENTKDAAFLQEVDAAFPEYPFKYYNYSKARKGYSGTAIWSRIEPLSVIYDIPNPLSAAKHDKHNREGRVITLEFPKFYVVHVYTPNSGEGLKRVDYRTTEWDVEFRAYIQELQKKKPAIVGGDLNVAPEPIDIHKPEVHQKSAGYTEEERENFRRLLAECSLVNSFRYRNPKKVAYSYWSYLFAARKYNKGWLIDHWLVDKKLKDKIQSSTIYEDVMGSDHAPIELILK